MWQHHTEQLSGDSTELEIRNGIFTVRKHDEFIKAKDKENSSMGAYSHKRYKGGKENE